MDMVGKHYFSIFYNCRKNRETLSDLDKMEEVKKEAAAAGDINIYNRTGKKFPNGGISHVDIVGLSHFAIHTWPEAGGLTIDIDVCTDEGDPRKAIMFLQDYFDPEETEDNYFEYGR